VRKQAKSYGTRQLAEGGDPRGRTVVLIEDVITTGGAVVHAAQALRELGATVTTVVCAIDRSHPGASGLTPEGIAVRSVLTKDMLDAAASGGPAAL
jgi:orotate phosphoribosyltransferase